MRERLEQKRKGSYRRRTRNTTMPSTRTTSESRQMQQRQNQTEQLLHDEIANEGQHNHQEANATISCNLVTGDCSTTIASTTTRITLGNAHDESLLRGLRRLTHVRRLARSLRQQTNVVENNPNNAGSTTSLSRTTRVTLGNEHDDLLLNGLRRLTHVRRLARSLRHQETTMGNNQNGESSTASTSTTTRVTLGNAQDDADLNGLRRLTHVRRYARSLRQQNNVGGNNPNNREEHA